MNDLFSRMMDFEEGTLSFEEVVELFQDLVNTGLAWQLQGFYGRTARALIEDGYIVVPSK